MTFDPDTFMNQTVDAPKGDTVMQQCPEGEFRAMIDDFDSNAFRSGEAGEQAKNPGKPYTIFSPGFVIEDAAVAQMLGRDKVVVGHKGMFLDFAADGSLDFGKGKNVDLNRLRDAVGQNVAGPWSFANLKGAGPVMVKVVHEPDRKDPEKKYAKVTRVTKID
jgi:hypothetical protein